MPRIELSIKTTYLPEWRTAEGIRELVQNAKDAETEFQAPMKILHNGNLLKISNEGVALEHEALLFGHTTKAERQDMIGKFGEGLKLGVLALVRAGHTVKILSGEEIWKPLLVRSASFQAEVLAFDISKGKHCGGVVVEIDKIPLAEWVEMRNNFLFLRDDVERIVAENFGELLLDPAMSGKVFVKGIFVQRDPKLMAGYNLYAAPTDRDRKIIPQYDLGWRLSTIWAKAVSIRADLVEKLYDLLLKDAPDIEDFSSYTRSYMSVAAQQALVAQFVKTFGQDAVPVASILESKDIGHFGKKGIVLPAAMARLLQILMDMEGGIEGIKRKVGAEIVAQHSWHDLTEAEQANLERAVEILATIGEQIPMDRLDIVSFRSETQYGLWNGKRIMVSKTRLSDLIKTLSILIHEYAHHLSEKSDGDKSHVDHIERIWSGVYAAAIAKEE